MKEKQAGRSHNETESLYKNVLNCIGAAVVITDRDGKIQNLNPEAEKLLGWTDSKAKHISLDKVFIIIDEKTGKLSISLQQKKSGTFDIVVQDDGVGLPINIDPENIESLGFKLIRILTEQLDRKLSIDKKAGTKFKLEFPVNKAGNSLF